MRLQVFLSRSGVCSRRKALELILAGRVSVSGKTVLEPSFDVSYDGSCVSADGRPVTLKEKIYLLFHKPKGVVTTREDKFAERKVTDFLPPHLRHLFPVGRLDKDTTGLLLLTNDGDLAFRLTHPSFGCTKTYRGTLDKKLSETDRLTLERGVPVDGKKTAACRLRFIPPCGFEMVLREGRKRQIRRMFETRRYKVLELMRTRQGPLGLEGLSPGAWRHLTGSEVRLLRGAAGQKQHAETRPLRRQR